MIFSAAGRALFLVAFLSSLVWGQKITMEFDEAQDFSDYRTYRIVDGALHSNNPSLNSPLVKKKIDGLIRKYLTMRGLTEVDNRPDLNIRYSLGSGRKTEIDRYPAGWRGYGTRVVAVHYTEGTLVMDLRDSKKHELVWRAIAIEDKTDPMKIQSSLEDMVRKSFEKYPPKKKK
jgi:hypothetical protein